MAKGSIESCTEIYNAVGQDTGRIQSGCRKAVETCGYIAKEVKKKKLEGEVKDVRLSARLKESAAVLVAEEWGMSAHMERLMQRMGPLRQSRGSRRQKVT